jgi:GT2 family glycosyltransferase|tara:strand:+ start:1119 stop:1988 length:870 start_codon:yes stop_codon:yes gene_type:complete
MNSINYNSNLTVIIVSFHSDQIIENLINSIQDDIKILVVENSLNFKLKKHLESNFKNVEVIIPSKNMGNGGGINVGLKLVKTKFSLYLDVDTLPEPNMINVLLEYTKKIKDFSVLAPRDKNFLYDDELYLEKSRDKNYHKMKFITGCALLFNMESVEKIGLFDENIFLYYEEHDFYYRCLKLGLNIYLLDDAKIIHHGSSSVDKNYNYEIQINRNWHYCWSKFYYFKKNFGYFYGIKKTIPNLFRAIRKYILYKIKRDFKKSSLHSAEINGLITSYLLKKSSRRPKLDT